MSIFKAIADKYHNDWKMLHQKINYVRNFQATTLDLIYGAGVASGISTYAEMIDVKNQYNQCRGKGFFHFVFAPMPKENVSEEILFEAGIEMAEAMRWFEGGGYQTLMAVHIDKPDELHVHFIMNNINFNDGTRLDLNRGRLYALKKTVSEIATSYGISSVMMYSND